MTMLFSTVVLAVILVGAALALQAPINASLARSIGDPVMAAAIQFGIGFAALGAFAYFKGSHISAVQIRAIPWWALTGGLLGALWVWVAIWSVPRLGVVTMISAMILGQMIAALAMDAGGIFGLEAKSISPSRVAAVCCVALGVMLSHK